MAVLTRADWGAGPHRAPPIPLPVRYLILHHTVTPFWTGAQAARNLQAIARARGFLDISYPWLIDRQGNEIEGRGWGRKGAHTRGYNTTGHAISLVGNLESHPLPPGTTRGLIRLVRKHARYGPGRITHPHSALSATACPGRHARPQIPAVNRAASSPSPGGFLMGLSDAQQTYLYDRVLRIERALTPKGDTLGSYRDSEVPDDRRLGHLVAHQLTNDTPDSRTVHDRATRALRHARAADERTRRIEAMLVSYDPGDQNGNEDA